MSCFTYIFLPKSKSPLPPLNIKLKKAETSNPSKLVEGFNLYEITDHEFYHSTRKDFNSGASKISTGILELLADHRKLRFLLSWGTIEQVDLPYANKFSNGLTIVIEKLKNEEITGHVNFTKGYRSELANIVAQKL